jgi:hypothetical protein
VKVSLGISRRLAGSTGSMAFGAGGEMDQSGDAVNLRGLVEMKNGRTVMLRRFLFHTLLGSAVRV